MASSRFALFFPRSRRSLPAPVPLGPRVGEPVGGAPPRCRKECGAQFRRISDESLLSALLLQPASRWEMERGRDLSLIRHAGGAGALCAPAVQPRVNHPVFPQVFAFPRDLLMQALSLGLRSGPSRSGLWPRAPGTVLGGTGGRAGAVSAPGDARPAGPAAPEPGTGCVHV